jgi:hypothetical protein
MAPPINTVSFEEQLLGKRAAAAADEAVQTAMETGEPADEAVQLASPPIR